MGRLITTFCLSASLLLLIFSVALPESAWAQSGKLAGTVIDAETGDPLPGANVVLQGTNRGTATDTEGRYSIIGITPGTYSVRYSLVGYAPKVVQEVRIVSDRTRTLDVELAVETIEGEEVVVTAERPVVQPDQTSSRTVFTSEDIESLPLTSLSEVVSNTAKSFDGFVRGSRRFGTKTVIEGIDVSNSYARASSINTNTRRGYGSTVRTDEVAVSMMNLSASGVEEVTVSTGATSASNPAGSGGVINVTLLEGRGPFQGTASVRFSPEITQPGPDSLDFYEEQEAYYQERELLLDNGDEARANLYTWTPDKYDVGGPEMNVDLAMGGSITDSWRMSFAGQFFSSQGFAPHELNQRINGQLKTSYDLTSRTTLSAIGLLEDRGLWGGWNNRNYSELWHYYLEGTAQDDGGNYVGSLRLRHVLSDESYVTVQAYRTYARTRYGYPDDDGDGLTEASENGDLVNLYETDNIEKYIYLPGVDAESVAYEKMFFVSPFPPGRSSTVVLEHQEPIRTNGPMPYFEDAIRATNALKLDYSNQIHPSHLLEAGVELKLMNFDYTETRAEYYPYYTLNVTEDVNDDGIIDMEPYAPSRWERSPTEFSIYLSDRMEYGDLIVNLGLRADIVDRDTEQIEDYFYPFRRDTVTVDGRTVARNFFNRGEDVPTDVFWNPRIGVSHPIGTQAAMYFAYARSQQLVPYSTLYHMYDGNHTTNHFLVYQDPAQDPITSNDYELGLQWEVARGWGLDVNAYMRSIDNYARQNLRANNRTPEGEPELSGLNRHTFQTSAGYADVRGIELQVQRRPMSLYQDVALGVTASYTFSSIETNNNAPGNTTVFNAEDVEGNQLPFDNVDEFNHFPAGVQGGASIISSGYNRRHRALLRGVLGLPLGFTVGADTRFSSGFLYPKAEDTDPRDRELIAAPYNLRIDLRLIKEFDIPGAFGVDVFMDVTNLTNRYNMIAYNTQVADAASRLQLEGIPGERLITIDGSPIYGPARNFYFGTRIRF